MSRHKIALAVQGFQGGGAELIMITLANEFIEYGFAVDYIVERDIGPYRDMLSPKANKIVLLSDESNKYMALLYAFLRLRRYLKTTDAAVVITAIRKINALCVLAKMLTKTGAKLCVREDDTLNFETRRGRIQEKIIMGILRFLYPKADCIITNSLSVQNDILNLSVKLDKNKVFMIYNPIKIPAFIAPAKRKGIIAAGRLTYKKNFTDLIAALPLVLERYSDMTLTILGEGEERAALERQIDELGLRGKVFLAGFVSDPFSRYAAAEVFVQTSLWEGFGNVLVEAMACGAPPVVYDAKGAMREILADGKYGILTPVGDRKALCAAICAQLENPTPSHLLQVAVARFEPCAVAGRYLEALGLSAANGAKGANSD
ncbi:MAG: glycosyltransferase [Helicobacteraceae bacterium]|jgi:glycosyltransferase involved in cell wall biosynthesis|nr:glycosyltransferase [Helicobacteraceae bacterium]